MIIILKKLDTLDLDHHSIDKTVYGCFPTQSLNRDNIA